MSASSGKIETALFATGFAMAGLVLFALVWSGVGAYIDMARAAGVSNATFYDHTTRSNTVELPLGQLPSSTWHGRAMSRGEGGPPPAGALYTTDEISHMADVRRVLTAQDPHPRRSLRDGDPSSRARAGASRRCFGSCATERPPPAPRSPRRHHRGARVDQAFLLFHEVFFPQGNFLFDPATSNLVRLYPDWYWQGITFRVGLSFVALAAAVAIAASVGLRRARSTRLASE